MQASKLKLAQEWFAKGDDDLASARILLEEDGPPNTICFLSHQAAEKYLKGSVILLGKKSRKIHDLVRLVNEVSRIDNSFLPLLDSCELLNPHYIEARYPLGPPASLPKSSARLALEASEEIVAHIQKKFA